MTPFRGVRGATDHHQTGPARRRPRPARAETPVGPTGPRICCSIRSSYWSASRHSRRVRASTWSSTTVSSRRAPGGGRSWSSSGPPLASVRVRAPRIGSRPSGSPAQGQPSLGRLDAPQPRTGCARLPPARGAPALIALIEEPAVIERFLLHLGLPHTSPEARPARAPPLPSPVTRLRLRAPPTRSSWTTRLTGSSPTSARSTYASAYASEFDLSPPSRHARHETLVRGGHSRVGAPIRLSARLSGRAPEGRAGCGGSSIVYRPTATPRAARSACERRRGSASRRWRDGGFERAPAPTSSARS